MIAPKRFCFANALLPFGAVWEANAQTAHSQTAKPTHDQSLQKSCFLADTLPDISIQKNIDL